MSPGRWLRPGGAAGSDDAAGSGGGTRPGGAAARAERLLGPAVTGLTGAIGVVLVTVVNPEQPGHYPVCPTLALTGFYCPGCGGLRAVHALTHGDLGLALHRNPVVVLALPFIAWAYLSWLRRRLLGRSATWLPPRALTWGIMALLAMFTVLRNLPAFGWLAP